MNLPQQRDRIYQDGQGGIGKGKWKRNENIFSTSNKLKKNIDLPDNMNSDNMLSQDIKDEISFDIDKIKSEYDIVIDEIEYSSIADNTKTPMQFVPVNKDGVFKSKLLINSTFNWNKSLDSLNERIYNKNYLKGILASKNTKDLVTHEMAHFMCFQDCKTWDDFLIRESMLRRKFVKGISLYSDNAVDGAESIAEGFVRFKNNEQIDDKTKKLIEQYIERWKK